MFGRAGKGLVDSEGPWLIPQIVWQFWMGLWIRRLQTCISVTHIYVASIVKVIDWGQIYFSRKTLSESSDSKFEFIYDASMSKIYGGSIFMLMERQCQVTGVK